MSMEEQVGRLEGKMDMMISNQDKMMNWFEQHAKSDSEKFEELNKSVSGIKGKMYVFGALFIAALEGGKHALMSWFGIK
jgi:hypothetical protein